jgi:acetolactate synthase-1/3 small subunit
VQVVDISSQDYVERDLMLIKVRAPAGGRRSEVCELAEIFRGRIVDVAAEEAIVEIAGPEKKIEAFIDLMRSFGIIELVRTGRIAMVRGGNNHAAPKHPAPLTSAAHPASLAPSP